MPQFAGVYGEASNWGNYGYLGGIYGAYGRHDNGNYGYLLLRPLNIEHVYMAA